MSPRQKDQLRITVAPIVLERLSRLAALEGTTPPKIAQMILFEGMLRREAQYRESTGKSVEELCAELEECSGEDSE